MDIPCVYGLDLFRWGTLNKCLFTEQEWTVLQKLLFLNLLQFNSKSFSSEERDIIGRMGWGMCDNAELKARALDVLRHFEKDKREYTTQWCQTPFYTKLTNSATFSCKNEDLFA